VIGLRDELSVRRICERSLNKRHGGIHNVYKLQFVVILGGTAWKGESHSSVIGLSAMLQVGRSRVQFPRRVLIFFFVLFHNLPHPPSRNMALGFTQDLTESSMR
jgi:hypothetical protein